MNSVKPLMILEDQHVQVVPFSLQKGFPYMKSVILNYRYNKVPEKLIPGVLDRYGVAFWAGRCKDKNNVCFGFGMLMYYPELNIYTFDAYRDEELCRCLKIGRKYSFCAGRLVTSFILDSITPTLYTMHPIRHRAATKMCKILGFVDEGVVKTVLGNMRVLKKTKVIYGT